MFLKRRYQVRQDLNRYGYFRPHRRSNDVLRLCLLDVFLRKRKNFAE